MTADVERERGARIALQPALHELHGLFGIGQSLRGSAGPEVDARPFAVHESVAGTGLDHLRELGDVGACGASAPLRMAGRRTRVAAKPKSENYARNGQAASHPACRGSPRPPPARYHTAKTHSRPGPLQLLSARRPLKYAAVMFVLGTILWRVIV
jgi:hypothetical protein